MIRVLVSYPCRLEFAGSLRSFTCSCPVMRSALRRAIHSPPPVRPHTAEVPFAHVLEHFSSQCDLVTHSTDCWRAGKQVPHPYFGTPRGNYRVLHCGPDLQTVMNREGPSPSSQIGLSGGYGLLVQFLPTSSLTVERHEYSRACRLIV